MSVGPITVFDKSALEMLSVDEACWLDAFYLNNITPLFFVETLADLEKQVAKGRTPEEVVGNLAYKTPPGAHPNVHHLTLATHNLLGAEVEMRQVPVLGGGKHVITGDKKGVVFSSPPEMEAMSRWSNGAFLEIERDFAKKWRRSLSGIDFGDVYRRYRGKLRSLEDAKKTADALVCKDGSRYSNLKMVFEILDVPRRLRPVIVARWKAMGGPPLSNFAPYTAHVLTVDLFFNLAIGSDLISRERPSNKIDIAYLYYLPFCMVFVSNDKLHAKTAPCFLRDDQAFIRGEELKADLAKLDAHYSRLPEDVKEQGIMRFAPYPPLDTSFLTTRLWDRFMAPIWRDSAVKPREIDPGRAAKLVEQMNRTVEDAARQSAVEPFDLDSADHVTLEHQIPVRMGKWRLLPPEVERAAGLDRPTNRK